MHQLEAERLARDMRDRAGIGADAVVSAVDVARPVVGSRNIQPVRLRGSLGILAKLRGEWFIGYRADFPDRNFIVAHELGHLARRLAGIPIDDLDEEEDGANRIGAAILAPRHLVEPLARDTGDDYGKISARFGVTQSCAVLRLSCVREEDVAVVAPTIHVLSYGGVSWPEDREEIRSWLSERRPRGLSKRRLFGAYDRGRVALVTAKG